ncbi:MAG: helix-turn-helix transcriptional regulator [Pyrinomonadaceae bacterium]|nr:helix-turn-helix transcriptional regulator [Pyrinomonadaceae bacterium]
MPASLNDWIRKTNLSVRSNEFNLPPSPLKIVAQSGELTARIVFNKQTGERTLMLEEKHFASPQIFGKLGVTRREAEILFWITQGKSDEAIAALLSINPRTVHKHVQNIYTKLGVETRTAAMLKALETI